MPVVTHEEIERVFRKQYARAVAVLARVFGDLDNSAEVALLQKRLAAVTRPER